MDKNIVGYALYCFAYSTWRGKSMYLQEFHVSPNEYESSMKNDLLSSVVKVGRPLIFYISKSCDVKGSSFMFPIFRQPSMKIVSELIFGYLITKIKDSFTLPKEPMISP